VSYDALFALAADSLDIEYAYGVIGSTLIYGGAGYAVARAGEPRRASAATGALVALIDATAGWAVAAAVGPGSVEDAGPVAIGLTIVAVTGLGALIGLLAALPKRQSRAAR